MGVFTEHVAAISSSIYKDVCVCVCVFFLRVFQWPELGGLLAAVEGPYVRASKCEVACAEAGVCTGPCQPQRGYQRAGARDLMQLRVKFALQTGRCFM